MELARERTSARSPRLHALKTDDEFAEHNEAEKREGNTTGMLGRGLWASDHISRKRFVSSEAWQPEHEKPESGAEEEFDGRGVRVCEADLAAEERALLQQKQRAKQKKR